MCKLGLSSGPPGGRPRARLKAGMPREAPTPAPTTGHRPHNSYPTSYEGRNNMESTNLQNYWRGGKSWAAHGAPRQHRDSTSHRAAELEPKHVLVAIQCRSQFNAGPYPRNMPLVAIQCSTSGAPPGCSGETCSLSEETKAPTATATRASCHKARHDWRGLPHPRRRVSSGGTLRRVAQPVEC